MDFTLASFSSLYHKKDRLILKQTVEMLGMLKHYMDRVKRIWYLSPMRAAKVQASLRMRAVSPEPSAARSYKQWVKRNLQTECQIPGPSECLGMSS